MSRKDFQDKINECYGTVQIGQDLFEAIDNNKAAESCYKLHLQALEELKKETNGLLDYNSSNDTYDQARYAILEYIIELINNKIIK